MTNAMTPVTEIPGVNQRSNEPLDRRDRRRELDLSPQISFHNSLITTASLPRVSQAHWRSPRILLDAFQWLLLVTSSVSRNVDADCLRGGAQQDRSITEPAWAIVNPFQSRQLQYHVHTDQPLRTHPPVDRSCHSRRSETERTQSCRKFERLKLFCPLFQLRPHVILPIASVITGLVLAMTAIGLLQMPSTKNSAPELDASADDLMRWAPAQGGVLVSSVVDTASVAGAAAKPVDPHLTMGSETCIKCHANEVKVWKATPHHRTFDELHRRPAAKEIASKLGVRSIKHDGRCVHCHYTQKVDVASGNVHAIEGVSCESCHGSAKQWLDLHHDYGGEQVTRAMETPEHRQQRLAQSVAAGMRNPVNVTWSHRVACVAIRPPTKNSLMSVVTRPVVWISNLFHGAKERSGTTSLIPMAKPTTKTLAIDCESCSSAA